MLEGLKTKYLQNHIPGNEGNYETLFMFQKSIFNDLSSKYVSILETLYEDQPSMNIIDCQDENGDVWYKAMYSQFGDKIAFNILKLNVESEADEQDASLMDSILNKIKKINSGDREGLIATDDVEYIDTVIIPADRLEAFINENIFPQYGPQIQNYAQYPKFTTYQADREYNFSPSFFSNIFADDFDTFTLLLKQYTDLLPEQVKIDINNQFLSDLKDISFVDYNNEESNMRQLLAVELLKEDGGNIGKNTENFVHEVNQAYFNNLVSIIDRSFSHILVMHEQNGNSFSDQVYEYRCNDDRDALFLSPFGITLETQNYTCNISNANGNYLISYEGFDGNSFQVHSNVPDTITTSMMKRLDMMTYTLKSLEESFAYDVSQTYSPKM